ncbi:hypothetical protein EOA29_03225 [Mesorhizobium sp. M1E.F.Ca.ET.063.01.1.1]|nr:hypothetical protein EOA29_03225 [Mesorhizobium sp. M1E.F.Ca.ET.063.01.1.1]
MPISDELRDVPVTFECPICNHPIVKKGSWFKAVSLFRCDACRTRLRLGYAAKLALFEKSRRQESRPDSDFHG